MLNHKFYSLLFLLVGWSSIQLMAEEVGVHRFATYNVRYVNPKNGDTGEKLWANRRQYVVRNITGYDFDVVGMEEVTGNNVDPQTGKSQLQDLRDMLTDYADFAVEREGRNYEYNAIFYKKAKYSLLEKGYFYVNEHPETPGAGWGAELPRSCLWVHLSVKNTGQDFYFFCTHANYGPTESGIQSGRLIGSKVCEIAGNKPVVLVGDFNMVRDNHEEAYRGYASRLYDLALTTPLNQCLPADGPQIKITTSEWTPAANHPSGQEYDYIFYDHMEPLSRHIITEYYPESGRTVNPSDHYPLMGRFRLQSAPRPTSFHASDNASLAQALASVTMGDTLCLTAGTYPLAQAIEPACSMVISGGWDDSFSAQTGYSHFAADGLQGALINVPHYFNMTLDHIELSGAANTATTGGGAIYSFGPEVHLQHCYIHDNTASAFGGGVVHKGEQITIHDCIFEANSSNIGGALYCQERDLVVLHDSRFRSNTATFGAAVELADFHLLDMQRSAFVDNTASAHGAVDIAPEKAPLAAHILNCSFLNNTLSAQKGMASITKRYGGTAIWADMTDQNIQLNIGLCSFMGNHCSFNGLDENLAGGALAVFKAKLCLMDNLVIANNRTIADNQPCWHDLYTTTDVNFWRNTYNLYSDSPVLTGWEQHITATFGGTLSDDGIYIPQVLPSGAYPVLKKTLGSYNLACLPTNQRLCESTFTYDLNGDGTIGGYIAWDMLNNQRAVRSCIGAVEYTGDEQDLKSLSAEDYKTTKVLQNGQILIIGKQQIFTINGIRLQ